MASITPGNCQCVKEPQDAMVHDPAIIAAGVMAKRTSYRTFAQSSWTCRQQVLASIDPTAISKMFHDRFVDSPRTAHIHVF
ncbi:hypothetical protein RAZWK3B_00355 [Roseobacter sp. AzwK-3b]|nr:hypothetical protein RAZWK3B_00355 [Roseobacter sp. AzwK-3b]